MPSDAAAGRDVVDREHDAAVALNLAAVGILLQVQTGFQFHRQLHLLRRDGSAGICGVDREQHAVADMADALLFGRGRCVPPSPDVPAPAAEAMTLIQVCCFTP